MQDTLERLRKRREELGDEGGFTLIELLIVIVILGILAAIVVFAVQNLTGNSAQASCSSDVQTVDHAAQAYLAQVGSPPGDMTSLLGTATVTVAGTSTQVVGPWLHNAVGNGTHYSIAVAPGTGATAGTPVITITGSGAGSPHTYVPSTENATQACLAAGAK